VAYTIFLSSTGNSRNGTNSFQLLSQMEIIARLTGRKLSLAAGKRSAASRQKRQSGRSKSTPPAALAACRALCRRER
jgi:hypothetical protein